jgi:two-component system, NtrC family, response regulator PilR
MGKARALVVDDEPDLTELVELTLRRMAIDTASAADLGAARRMLDAEPFDLCLTDMRLPDGDGLDLVQWIQQRHPDVPVAVITAHGNVELAVRALKLGAFDFVSKPLDVGVLRKLVNSAIRLGTTAETTGVLQLQPLLLGQSEPIQRLREMIGRVARSQAPVHISGESGSGKELVARLIHQSGPRHDGPFVAINCGAIPTELMESELFGHRRGSFTGATSDKPGLIRSAEGGTLFLDEIAELPLHMQVKLLRVIQERSVRGVGEERETAVDLRFLSATHRSLAALVASKQFREDLYYRLNVIELHMPALRERREDLDELTASILKRQASKLGVPVPMLSAAARTGLNAHPFPGNVRELENVLERALALHAGGTIDVADLQLREAQPPAQQKDPVAPPLDTAEAGRTVGIGGSGEALTEQLLHMERDAIVKALEAARFNKTAAARALGISFRALRYKLKKLGID